MSVTDIVLYNKTWISLLIQMYIILTLVFHFRHVRRLPYVDEKKIGIWGWGYGGYLTIRALSQDSKLVSIMSRDSSQANRTRDIEVGKRKHNNYLAKFTTR